MHCCMYKVYCLVVVHCNTHNNAFQYYPYMYMYMYLAHSRHILVQLVAATCNTGGKIHVHVCNQLAMQRCCVTSSLLMYAAIIWVTQHDDPNNSRFGDYMYVTSCKKMLPVLLDLY